MIHAYASVLYMKFTGILYGPALIVAYAAILLVGATAIGTKGHYTVDIIAAIMYCHGIKDIIM